MRSFWCTLIAVCLLAAGVRPTDVPRTRDVAASFHAVSASVAPAARRLPRAHDLGAYVPTATPVVDTEGPRAIEIAHALPPRVPASIVPAARLARGPPLG